MIWRDDDVGKFTDITTIMRIQELFRKHNEIHTVVVLMEDLWESHGVWEWLMTTPDLDIALHGWTHESFRDFSFAQARDVFARCLDYWKMHTGRIGRDIPIKVWYPPWNEINDEVKMACDHVGLEWNDSVDESQVYNFHWWEFIGGRGLGKLEEILKNGSA